MSTPQSLHSICRWTFNAGKGGFVPAGIRPAWAADRLDTAGMVRLVKEKIAPRLPAHVALGLEVHYDAEINERNAAAVTDALAAANMHLALISPNAHTYCAYGGVASLDPGERSRAADLAQRTVEMAYGPLRSAWHPDPKLAPSFVIWNGSLGYDLATIGIRRMYQNLKEAVAQLCDYERKKGGMLYFAIEPKPNEGHPAMLLPTVASAILFWKRLREEFGTDISRMGVNKEFGHSEMIGLDHVYDTVEEIDNGMLVHMHLNSQGYNDGIVLGGPGKYDIDHGTRINGMNIAIAGLIAEAGFVRWKGHDMQVRAYDNEEQGIDRVVRSILSWEACAEAARALNVAAVMRHLEARQTAQAEDLMRAAVVDAQRAFDRMYRG
jgi:xylose isomerase